MQVSRVWIPTGDFGTLATLGHMRRLAREAVANPLVRATAVAATDGTGGKDAFAQAMAIRNWLVRNTAFLRDPNGTELLHSPRYMLAALRTLGPPLRIDCDDVAVLGAALGGAVGLRARFVVAAFFSPSAPFRHVWTELSAPWGTVVGTRWVELDTTRSGQSLPSFNAISRIKTVEVF
jgi:transglutaminase-like putative cysteine protease